MLNRSHQSGLELPDPIGIKDLHIHAIGTTYVEILLRIFESRIAFEDVQLSTGFNQWLNIGRIDQRLVGLIRSGHEARQSADILRKPIRPSLNEKSQQVRRQRPEIPPLDEQWLAPIEQHPGHFPGNTGDGNRDDARTLNQTGVAERASTARLVPIYQAYVMAVPLKVKSDAYADRPCNRARLFCRHSSSYLPLG